MYPLASSINATTMCSSSQYFPSLGLPLSRKKSAEGFPLSLSRQTHCSRIRARSCGSGRKRRGAEGGVMASGSGSFLKVVLKNFDVLAGPLVTLVYPLYASVKAIETKSVVDDQQWLTYWVLYSMITLFELTFAKVLEWLPFWSYAKLMGTCWLVLPYFNGAAFVYEHYVRPYLINHQMLDLRYVPRKDKSTKPDVLQAAEKYIAENGPEALERLIGKSEKSSKSCGGGSSNWTILDDVRAERESKSVSGYYNNLFDEDYRY